MSSQRSTRPTSESSKEYGDEEGDRERVPDAGRGLASPGDADEDRSGGFEHGGWQLPYFDDVAGGAISEGMEGMPSGSAAVLAPPPFSSPAGDGISYHRWADHWGVEPVPLISKTTDEELRTG